MKCGQKEGEEGWAAEFCMDEMQLVYKINPYLINRGQSKRSHVRVREGEQWLCTVLN